MPNQSVFEPFTVAFIVLWVITLFLCVLMIAVLRHLGVLYDGLDPILRFRQSGLQLSLGEHLPIIHVERLDQTRTSLRELGDMSLFIVIARLGCEPCGALLRAARSELGGQHAPGWRPIVLVQGSALEARRLAQEYDLDSSVVVLADPEGATARDWGISTTPFAVAVDPNGRIVRKLTPVNSQEVIEALTHAPSRQVGPKLWPFQSPVQIELPQGEVVRGNS